MSTKRIGGLNGGGDIRLDMSDVNYRQMGLVEKLKRHYYQEELDAGTIEGARQMSSFFFHYSAVTLTYLALRYLIPFYYADCSPWAIYLHKVFFCFLYISATGNWLCTRCYSSVLRWTADQPDLNKSLWQDCIQNGNGQGDGNHNGEVTSHSNQNNGNGHVISVDKSACAKSGWCDKCHHAMPFRTHHCKVCKRCILKRDHHCYFTGVCIGYWNQRYFVVLSFYVGFTCFYGMLLVIYYTRHTLWPVADGWTYVLPVTWWRWWQGELEHQYIFVVAQLYTVWWGGAVGVGFFFWQMYIIAQGTTSHEAVKNIRIPGLHGRSMSENFKSVFGPFWALNFLWPMQLLYRQSGDGIRWFETKHY